MKLTILDQKNTSAGTMELPVQFKTPVRVDLIARAVLASQANARQAYGASPMAGMRHSVDLSKRRRDYKGSYGKGISRTPRKTLSRNGSQMFWVGAQAPNTVGGRQAHPPKPSKDWSQKVNEKERRLALRSALASVVDKNIVLARGHKLPPTYPFVIDSSFETIVKTKDVTQALELLGLTDELARSSVVRIRAGRGKMRGRPTKKTVGPLLVVSKTCSLSKAARNIAGITVVQVANLQAQDLAPGCAPGRLTLFTKPALEEMKEKKLFL